MKVDLSCAGVIQTTLSLVLPAQSTQVSELALTFVVSTTNAPIKLPITPEHINNAQKMLLYSPLFFSFAHIEMYCPYATQSIAALNPLMTAATRITDRIKVGLSSQLVELGSCVLYAGSTKLAT